jgi:TatD DNase family protein
MLTDSHCHLDAPEFDGDRADVMRRARDAGVATQIVPAIHAAEWTRLREVCAQCPGTHAAYGLHPMYLSEHRPEHLQTLREWVDRERPVAIGECGLDYFVEDLDRDAQQTYFDAQLRLAREVELPVIVHARRAVDAVIASIRRINADGADRAPLRGVIHSYPGSREQARQLRELGFLLGIGGPVTYERAHRLRALVADMPIEQLLLETDAPDQPDAGIRGRRNEPERLRTVLDTVAELRGESPDAIARRTSANAAALFGLAHAA